MENLGEKVFQRRKELGWSLQELSDRTGISTSYLNRIEKGNRKSPSYDILTKLLKVLQISVDEKSMIVPESTVIYETDQMETLKRHVKELQVLLSEAVSTMEKIDMIVSKRNK